MLFHQKRENHLDRLEDRLQRARVVTPVLLKELMEGACPRLSQGMGNARARIEQLVAAGAFTDASLALVAAELPRWTLRRLVREEGEWLCSLSRQSLLPIELDDSAEGHHEDLALAVLMALVRAVEAADHVDAAVSVPQIRASSGQAVCCDNFG
jgi:hypothetical protein